MQLSRRVPFSVKSSPNLKSIFRLSYHLAMIRKKKRKSPSQKILKRQYRQQQKRRQRKVQAALRKRSPHLSMISSRLLKSIFPSYYLKITNKKRKIPFQTVKLLMTWTASRIRQNELILSRLPRRKLVAWRSYFPVDQVVASQSKK